MHADKLAVEVELLNVPMLMAVTLRKDMAS